MSSPRQKEAERVCASVRLNSQEERARVAAKATQRDHAAEVSVADFCQNHFWQDDYGWAKGMWFNFTHENSNLPQIRWEGTTIITNYYYFMQFNSILFLLGIPPKDQFLVVAGKIIKCESIANFMGSTICLSPRLRGGVADAESDSEQEPSEKSRRVYCTKAIFFR